MAIMQAIESATKHNGTIRTGRTENGVFLLIFIISGVCHQLCFTPKAKQEIAEVTRFSNAHWWAMSKHVCPFQSSVGYGTNLFGRLDLD